MPEIVMERRTEPVTALRAARLSRGWSLRQVVERLRVEADRQEVRIGTHANSVKVLLIGWEKGRRAPRPVYVGLLTAIYEMSAVSLGLPEPRTSELSPEQSEQWAALFERYHGFVRRWIYRRVDDWHLADDLASETFLKVREALSRNPELCLDNAYRWLAVQARWVVADYYAYRCPKRERLAFGNEDGALLDWEAEGELSHPEEAVTDAMSVHSLLSGLSVQERALVTRRFLVGMTMARVRESMGLSVGTANRVQRQALATLHASIFVGQSLADETGTLGRAA